MKKFISLLLITVMCSLTIASSALAASNVPENPPIKVVIDEHALKEVYERYASVTDEEVVVKMLMADFGFSEAEVRELLEINKQAGGPSTRSSSIEGTLPSSAPMGTIVDIVYTIDFKELNDMAKITKFVAKQIGAGGVGVATAALIAQIIFSAFQAGGVNYARVTVSYTYGYTNDGVLGWTPGYTKYEYW